MPELFDKHGGFRRLHSFTLATIVQLETLRFCRRFLTHDHRNAASKFYDPKGRQYDQMTQAARSGRQNIIEGSERSSTSKDTEMKLTDVARASLSELRGDYEIFILDRGELPWSCHSSEARALNAISLDPAPFSEDMVHESAKHALAERIKYARWLDDDDPVVVANAMLLIIGRALNMLKSQIASQGEAFEQTGGFSERLSTRRLAKRDADSNAPTCPQCSSPMRRRKSAQGEFWGCASYPTCKGTRPIELPAEGPQSFARNRANPVREPTRRYTRQKST
ncbi:MAG: four helix bundle suffix domain-containing protein [Terrimicrobiaceae bacterium]|nr:four helix bundle suffix domain-containing protein [Terrimicrobiaceae bacterium]